MKAIINILLCVFLTSIISSAEAQTLNKLKSSKSSVSGSSSLHEWESEITKLEWSGLLSVEDNKLAVGKDVVVKIPVKSIKSTKGNMMDNKTYDAFNADKNPTITFKLISIKISGTGKDYILDATGTLIMAGASKNIGMTLKASLLPNGDIQLTGNKKLNMKDFGMEPPTAMLGTIKVGEEVTVAFDLIITR
jgi:polyisoprenoid-binding protein YceI